MVSMTFTTNCWCSFCCFEHSAEASFLLAFVTLWPDAGQMWYFVAMAVFQFLHSFYGKLCQFGLSLHILFVLECQLLSISFLLNQLSFMDCICLFLWCPQHQEIDRFQLISYCNLLWSSRFIASNWLQHLSLFALVYWCLLSMHKQHETHFVGSYGFILVANIKSNVFIEYVYHSIRKLKPQYE